MTHLPVKRALISVSNKEGLVPFAQGLQELGIVIISTGGTAQLLREENIDVTEVSELTGFPEIMDGRVKTLHPKIHGGILGKRQEHAQIAQEQDIEWIDLVVVNLYPFVAVTQRGDTFENAIENIDIGGPAMIRAAAKNMEHVTVVVDHHDYNQVLAILQDQGGLSLAHRKSLAQKAFMHTAHYDDYIAQYLANRELADFQDFILMPLKKAFNLRYGENPHQKAAAYHLEHSFGILDAKIHQGKPLSYNNLLDTNAALACVQEFESDACVIVKHCNPCGVALGINIQEAFLQAHKADSTAAFGGIIALNRPCDEDTAKAICESFFEVLIAPGFTEEALRQFTSKPALRVLELPMRTTGNQLNYQFIQGGLLVQTTGDDTLDVRQWQVVTEKTPNSQEMDALLFAWKVVKHVKSNAIVLAKNNQTLGIGPGQVSRVDAVETALRKAGTSARQAILASDAFFPFRDSIDLLAEAGLSAIIQPGGSIRDQEVINACNQHGLAMVFTGTRCFKH